MSETSQMGCCPNDQPCIFTEVLKNIETGIFILDIKNRSVFFKNRHAVKILEFIQTSQDYDALEALMINEISEASEGNVKLSNRTIINCDHRSFGYTVYSLEDNQQFLAVFIRDITDQSRLDAIDEASEMMNNISYLFSGIRHEIGNPLNSMKMALTVLQNNIERFSKEEFEVYLKRLSVDINRMEGLLKSFKNFNMFEQPKTTSVDLFEFFDSLTQLIGTDVRRKDIDIVVDLLPEARWARVDTRALQHVSMNIIANAIDALGEEENPKLKIQGEAVNDMILLSIIDNGCGMPDDLMNNAFKPFYTTKTHGTGLGLVISKKMLAQMNCGIEISSEKGVGTVVTLTMPKGEPLSPSQHDEYLEVMG